MQKTIWDLKDFGLKDTISIDKLKNVLKIFNRIHYREPEEIVMARIIR